MKPRRPDSKLCEQFFKLVLETKEEAVQDYLENAYFAFEDGHLEAAIVLAWAAIERYCNLVRKNIGEWYFDFKYKLANGNKNPKKHWSLDEFIKLSKETKFFIDIGPKLKDGEKFKEFEEARHSIAHGAGGFLKSCEEAYELIASAEFIFQRDVFHERIRNPIDLAKDFLKRPEIPDDSDTLVRFMQYIQFSDHHQVGGFCLELYNTFLLNRLMLFGKNEEKELNVESLSGLCACAIKTLDETPALHIWEAFITEALKILKSTDPKVEKIRDAYDIFEFLPFPTSSQTSAVRDEFLNYLFEIIERDLDDIQLELMPYKNQLTIPKALEDKFAKRRRIIRDLNTKVQSHLREAWSPVFDKYKNLVPTVYGEN